MKLYGLIGFPLTHSFSKKYFDNNKANIIIGDSEVSNSFELKGTSAPLTFEISSDNYNSWTSTSVE